MAYDVEVMSLGTDLYPLLQPSIDSVNAVQSEFRFRLTSSAQRQDGLGFKRTEYLTADVWAFLRDQRARHGGNRPYIIAFVDAKLKSSELSNIFGSHSAEEGLAAVTIRNATQYVKEARRFCCYYLVRYVLSFVNPLIKSHTDPARSSCYFHKKIYKPDIRESMDSGVICDEDQHHLDNPPNGTAAKRLSADERDALQRMRDVVRGAYPYALVLKGGGVKGLALAGALAELQKYFYFDRHIGTSAGAIAAVLLAAGYSPDELIKSLSDKNFRDFMDTPWWKLPFNLLFRGGCHAGEHARLWINERLMSKLKMQDEVKMRDLNGAIVYATRRGAGTVVFDSKGERMDAVAAFAARCSMSIPFFFVPQLVDGRRVFDGGLRHNFPVGRFLEDHPQTPFIGLYIASPNTKNRAWIGSELLDIWIDGEERRIVDKYASSMVVIDTSPIGTIDFGLTALEKELLLRTGRASALAFLRARKLDDGPSEAMADEAIADADKCRRTVIQIRRRKRFKRIAFLLLAVAVAYFILSRRF